ncbi:MAG TPA: PRC-barrel domain-containing protein [Pseudolabrys sp.]|nr:PRC-barrel domain-containing protein [Pseudolabrys sp.]
MKKIVLGTAIASLMLSTALAQAPSTPDTSSPSPSATSPSTPSTPSPSTSASSPAASAGATTFVSTQQPDQLLASKFKGTNVVGADNAKIGDVSDMLFDKDGKIEAYIVSVGGFLGVGSKSVAIPPQAFEIVKGTNGEADQLKLAATKDQLKEAQAFEPYNPPRVTTGSGAGGMGATRPATPPATSR